MMMLLLLPLSGTQMLQHDEDANSSATELKLCYTMTMPKTMTTEALR
jgi:hypothetical protein